MRVLVVSWFPGGNLPPLLAAASGLARGGHEVTVMASGHTDAAAEELGLPVVGFQRSPDPDVDRPYEAQAGRVRALAAGMDIALDAGDAIADLQPALTVTDCMLPAALAAGEASGIPTASVVHFLYGPARRWMAEHGGGLTTDLNALAATRRGLGLCPHGGGLAAWEAPDLVLVTAPRWLDVEAGAPDHVVHAGPLGIQVRSAGRRLRLLMAFSTTVMEGQTDLIERAGEAVAGLQLPATLTLGGAIDREALDLADGVEVLDVADHDRLLGECALVICHGGLGTVARSLAHGVPLVVLPLGRDQALNAGRIEELGAGIALPADASPRRIRAAVETLLDDGSFRAAAERAAARIARDRPDRAAVEALERCAAP